MRSISSILPALTLAACASGAPADLPHDEAAHALGADLAADAGGGDLVALDDIVRIARGGRARGFVGTEEELQFARYGGVTYQYAVTCRDAVAKRVACGEWTVSAEAIAMWGGRLDGAHLDAALYHHGAWTLHDLWRTTAWATGTSFSVYDLTFEPAPGGTQTWIAMRREGTLLVDTGTARVVGGSMQATLEVTGDAAAGDADAIALDATVTFEAPGRARLELGGTHAYWLDTETGTVSAAVILE